MNIISKTSQKIKRWLEINSRPVFIFSVIFLSTAIVWGVIKTNQQPKFQIQAQPLQIGDIQNNASSTVAAVIIGNKNSKIYHLEDCPGALKMLEQNKVFFNSAASAIAAGYRAAKNCPALEYLK